MISQLPCFSVLTADLQDTLSGICRLWLGWEVLINIPGVSTVFWGEVEVLESHQTFGMSGGTILFLQGVTPVSPLHNISLPKC